MDTLQNITVPLLVFAIVEVIKEFFFNRMSVM